MTEQIHKLNPADERDLLTIASLAHQILASHPEPEKKVEESNPHTKQVIHTPGRCIE
jgi:hypothetical protein